MKNLISSIVTTMVTIARGHSTWVFEIPTNFNTFMLNLYWACVYDSVNPKSLGPTIHSWRSGSHAFEIWEEEFNSSTDLLFVHDKIVFQTFWSGYIYILTPSKNGGIRIEFQGPRAAFAAQDLMPRQIANLLDWRYCIGMYDANAEWFNFDEVLDFYRKVDREHFFWDFLHLKEESQPTFTTNKSARHSGEGTFNFEKWDHYYCSHRSKGTTLKTHRGGKRVVDGYFHKECPLWMMEK